MLGWLRSRLLPRPHDETSRLVVGSTGSGKSEGELVDLVRLADTRAVAVVLLDGHGPIAFHAAGYWVAHGHEARLVYEPLAATDRILCWDMPPGRRPPTPPGGGWRTPRPATSSPSASSPRGTWRPWRTGR